MNAKTFTIPELARHLDVPVWKTRRVVDALDIPVQRIGLYRVVTAELVPTIREELERQNWLPTGKGGEA